ncbi:MAG TPA: DUF5691 domain-containing protein [Patescibacteria group bacterium]|nr:DUF5691 domain-containing protein [Patescibacteria group bacterium]
MTEEIVKTAILGTDKYLPTALSEIEQIWLAISAQQSDREDTFLKGAAAAFLYEEAARSGLQIKGEIAPCPFVSRSFISAQISNQIEIALETKNDVILFYLLYQCKIRDLIVENHLIPDLLNKAVTQKKRSGLISDVCVETGVWLCSLNPDWQNIQLPVYDESAWETGAFEQRKEYLISLRNTQPQAALKLLKESIHQDNAAARAEFISLLDNNLTLQDEAFLEEQLSDKSQKVRAVALHLLKKLPGSRLNSLFLKTLTDNSYVKEERSLLLLKKQVLFFKESLTPDPQIFKAGVEKVSNQKGVDDAPYWIAQILEYVAPTAYASALGISETELFKVLAEHQYNDIFLPYLVRSAVHLKNKTWAKLLLETSKVYEIPLLQLLDTGEQESFYKKFLAHDFSALFNYLINEEYNPISADIAMNMIEHLRSEPYLLNSNQYQLLSLHLPDGMDTILEQFHDKPVTEYKLQFFKTNMAEMIRVFNFKNSLKF